MNERGRYPKQTGDATTTPRSPADPTLCDACTCPKSRPDQRWRAAAQRLTSVGSGSRAKAEGGVGCPTERCGLIRPSPFPFVTSPDYLSSCAVGVHTARGARCALWMHCLAGIIGACVSLALDSRYVNPGSKGMKHWIGLRLKRPTEMVPTVDRPVDLGYFIGYRSRRPASSARATARRRCRCSSGVATPSRSLVRAATRSGCPPERSWAARAAAGRRCSVYFRACEIHSVPPGSRPSH